MKYGFKLRYQYDENSQKVVVRIDAGSSIKEIMQAVRQLLIGCTFSESAVDKYISAEGYPGEGKDE